MGTDVDMLLSLGRTVMRRGSVRLDVGNIGSVQTCYTKGVLCGDACQQNCIYLGSPGKNYTRITLSRERMKEMVFISGKAITLRCSLVVVFSSSNFTGYKLSQATIRFYFPVSFWHSFLKYLLNSNATVESLY